MAFPKKMQNKIYSKFIQVSPSLTSNAQQSISGQRQNSRVEPSSSGLLSSLMGEKSVTQRWERGELSNFQYLMHLNTLAGRSYNDLMQYPVFPWIVADYDSNSLDLHRPSTFRQLHKPMGAQTAHRLNQFERRYREWDDPSGETPPYHYGTHYSSAMIVAFYLVRMEPFTQHFLKLQGGHFDLADRMFHSVKDTWDSASQHNMADIKELIPEFFYLPNFLDNSNRFDLGQKQSGTALDNIILPPWAKGDPREFIRAHREALECDYVSAHLNEWIDLIFGYKQTGDPAVEAVNVFHHLFYEGNVDIYSIHDPLKRSAVVGFINNFGQIPKQLFKKSHPSKRLAIPAYMPPLLLTSSGEDSDGVIAAGGSSNSSQMMDPMAPVASSNLAERLFYHNLDNLEPTMQPVKELKSAVGQIMQLDLGNSGSGGSSSSASAALTSSSILAVEQNKCLIPTNFNRYVAWGFSDGSLRIGNCDSDKLVKVYEMPDPHGDILCVVCPNERTLVTGGVSTVVRVWSMVNQFNSDGSSIGSGSSNLTSNPSNPSSSSSSSSGGSSLSSTLGLRANLYGHIEAVTCMASAASYNLLVTGSRDRSVLLWDLGRLLLLRQLLPQHPGPVAALCISEQTGTIASAAGTHLHLWAVEDGALLASVNTATGRSKQILTVAMSTMLDWDPGNVVITGGTDGVVRMWSLEYVQVPLDPSSPSAAANDSGAATDTNTDSSPHQSAVNQQPPKSPATTGESMLSTSCFEEEDTEDEEMDRRAVSQDTREATEEDRTATLTRSKSVVTPDRTKNDSTEELEEEYVVIGSSEMEQNCMESQSLSGEKGKVRKPTPLVFKSASQPILRHDVRKLRKGFQWQRQLIFRSKLTMHTAFERADNALPSPVSAVTVSRDHRAVLVGDQRGRVFCWSVPSEPGRSMADHWLRDETADSCGACRVRFSLTERRHHCRNCGLVFCNKCSKYEIEIHRLRLFKPVRVCYKCYTGLTSQQQYPRQRYSGGGTNTSSSTTTTSS